VSSRFILACLLVLVTLGAARPATESSNVGSPLLYTVASSYEPLAWMRGADRFSSDAAIYLYDSAGQHRVVPGFAASADASVSYDGERILFAGKAHTQDPWQIWEIAVAGGDLRRITNFPEDCIRPFYLPENRIVYARKVAGRFVIETKDLASSKTLPLTYILSNALPTDVLRDGRILFEAAYPLGSEGNPEIYTVYSDGSGVESYRCDHGPLRHSGHQNSAGDILFSSARGVARFTSARAQQLSVPAPAGEYADHIVETPSGDWLASWRPEAKIPFRLMRWTPGTNRLQLLLSEKNANPAKSANVVQPTLLAERPVPNRHPSGLHDWPNANLLCLNAYTSKYQFAPGSIHAVRLYTADGVDKVKLLGTAMVERDGSFFLQVPTEQPIQIELLDPAGKTLKRESGFFWMRRGEQRACVGCHAGPETAPENAVPMILLKSTTPADMTGASPQSAAGGH
jgi:Hydrazine synthase alpha subunit middle domain